MRLYAAVDDALFVVTAEAGAWTAESVTALDGRRLECVAASGGTVLVGTFDAGLWRSPDAGETVQRVEGPLASASVTSVATDGEETWWVGTEPSAVYRSVDDGATWTHRDGLSALGSASTWSFPPRPDTHHVRWIQVDPHDADHLYVAVEAGALVQTWDGGETWHDRVEGSRRDTHSMATHPDAPGRAYCAAGDGYAETSDGGETWTHPQEGLDHRYCWSVAVDPADADCRLLSSARGPMAAHRPSSADSHVYRRRGDDAWHRLEGLPTGRGVTRYELLATGEQTFVALSNRGLFRTTDRGDSWERLPLSVPDDATARGLAAPT